MKKYILTLYFKFLHSSECTDYLYENMVNYNYGTDIISEIPPLNFQIDIGNSNYTNFEWNYDATKTNFNSTEFGQNGQEYQELNPSILNGIYNTENQHAYIESDIQNCVETTINGIYPEITQSNSPFFLNEVNNKTTNIEPMYLNLNDKQTFSYCHSVQLDSYSNIRHTNSSFAIEGNQIRSDVAQENLYDVIDYGFDNFHYFSDEIYNNTTIETSKENSEIGSYDSINSSFLTRPAHLWDNNTSESSIMPTFQNNYGIDYNSPSYNIQDNNYTTTSDIFKQKPNEVIPNYPHISNSDTINNDRLFITEGGFIKESLFNPDYLAPDGNNFENIEKSHPISYSRSNTEYSDLNPQKKETTNEKEFFMPIYDVEECNMGNSTSVCNNFFITNERRYSVNSRNEMLKNLNYVDNSEIENIIKKQLFAVRKIQRLSQNDETSQKSKSCECGFSKRSTRKKQFSNNIKIDQLQIKQSRQKTNETTKKRKRSFTTRNESIGKRISVEDKPEIINKAQFIFKNFFLQFFDFSPEKDDGIIKFENFKKINVKVNECINKTLALLESNKGKIYDKFNNICTIFQNEDYDKNVKRELLIKNFHNLFFECNPETTEVYCRREYLLLCILRHDFSNVLEVLNHEYNRIVSKTCDNISNITTDNKSKLENQTILSMINELRKKYQSRIQDSSKDFITILENFLKSYTIILQKICNYIKSKKKNSKNVVFDLLISKKNFMLDDKTSLLIKNLDDIICCIPMPEDYENNLLCFSEYKFKTYEIGTFLKSGNIQNNRLNAFFFFKYNYEFSVIYLQFVLK
ncbi:hypothetical protein EDEG_02331 [Edhazardia aedis USNM 41457]|uniref:Uncharacterized protein n=1 Tax=Edhazardia aedis (strain USNM 41457) TaxID=1003232 RepID=J8ZUH0_EDHAE|nr:hypothetical protein EDEG_02331 [Edhazardia aedis USNM 41457]|eukprot:EJW03323.1 hypothetical protein EDEG_02331 [Edhazardia aedis USNM 41457]